MLIFILILSNQVNRAYSNHHVSKMWQINALYCMLRCFPIDNLPSILLKRIKIHPYVIKWWRKNVKLSVAFTCVAYYIRITCKFMNQYLIVRNVAPINIAKFVYQTVNPALAYHDLVIIVQTSFPFSNVRCEWYPPLITRKCESHYSGMVLPTFLLHFLPLLDLGVTIGRKITIGIQIEVCFHLYICQNYFISIMLQLDDSLSTYLNLRPMEKRRTLWLRSLKMLQLSFPIHFQITRKILIFFYGHGETL